MIKKISGKYVIGYVDGEHVIYENGCVVYEGDTIIFVGNNYNGKVDESIDSGNAIVSPGFIDLDALGDIDHALIFSEIDTSSRKYLAWHEEYFDNYREENMSVEEEAFKSYFAYTHLIKNGITTAMPITSVLCKKNAETYDEAVAAAHHAGSLGLRTYLGPSYISAKNVIGKDGIMKLKFIESEGIQGFEAAVKFAKTYGGAYNGLINAVLVPERIEMQTEDIIIKSKKVADDLNIPIRMHAAQGAFEYSTIYEKHGKSTIAYLDSIGFLNEKTLIPHAILASGYSKLDDKSNKDLDILRDTKTTVIHCPLVYARSGIALESFGRYVRHGINMAIGTDTFPCDIIENMKTGSFIARLMDSDKAENSFRNFFNAATIGGAKALGRNDLGKLEKGAKADIIVIDLSGYHMGAADDPLRTLCLCGNGRDVSMSVINGRTVMQNRQIPGLNEEDALKKAQDYYNKMKNSYMIRNMRRIKEEELFKPSFKTIQ